MSDIVLPPRYYLEHFEEFLREVHRLHHHLMDDVHGEYLEDFKKLSVNARCLLIRMINRTGVIFHRTQLQYDEIQDFDGASAELKQHRFVRSLTPDDKEAYVLWLKKEDLENILGIMQVTFKRSATKDDLMRIVLSSSFTLNDIAFDQEDVLVLERQKEVEYLMFLYFGKLQNKLILPTLRDLGIRQASKKGALEAKFKEKSQAKAHYFYAQLKHQLKKQKLTSSIDEVKTWPQSDLVETNQLREELLLKVSEFHKSMFDLKTSLEILRLTKDFPASVQKARTLHQLGHNEECLKELERMLEDPLTDEELLFADDFLQRKYNKKRLSHLTETLRNAEKILIDESFYRQPEFGVLNYYEQQGQKGCFSENELWIKLFWKFFEKELAASAHSEFDHAPAELTEKTFLQKHQKVIAEKMDQVLLEDLKLSFEGDSMVLSFLTHVKLEQLKAMLMYMAEDYYQRSSGFPDLFIFKENDITFIEVKAIGDSLKPSQIKQLRQLERVGFTVKILQVDYKFSAEQTYVVVDLETTGAVGNWNRITEIGAVKIRNNEVIDRYQTLVNPDRSIPENIQALTGITNEMVRNAPRFKDVADPFRQFCAGSIFVAHNASFDYGFLQLEYERLGERFVMPNICTRIWMRKYFPGLESYGLRNLCDKFLIPLVTHHRALCDAEAAAGLLNLINEKRRQSV